MYGQYLRLSQKREVYVELRPHWLGFGLERYEEDTEVFLGFLQITHSVRCRGHAAPTYRHVRRRLVVASLLIALIVPSPLFSAALEGTGRGSEEAPQTTSP